MLCREGPLQETKFKFGKCCDLRTSDYCFSVSTTILRFLIPFSAPFFTRSLLRNSFSCWLTHLFESCCQISRGECRIYSSFPAQFSEAVPSLGFQPDDVLVIYRNTLFLRARVFDVAQERPVQILRRIALSCDFRVYELRTALPDRARRKFGGSGTYLSGESNSLHGAFSIFSFLLKVR